MYNKFRRLNVPRDCWIHIAPDEQTEFANWLLVTHLWWGEVSLDSCSILFIVTVANGYILLPQLLPCAIPGSKPPNLPTVSNPALWFLFWDLNDSVYLLKCMWWNDPNGNECDSELACSSDLGNGLSTYSLSRYCISGQDTGPAFQSFNNNLIGFCSAT